VRKTSPLDTLPGLTGETILAAPFALGWLALNAPSPTAAFGETPTHALLVAATGPATVAPLLCFVDAARRLRFSTLGILQFLAPTLQFLQRHQGPHARQKSRPEAAVQKMVALCTTRALHWDAREPTGVWWAGKD